MRLRWLLCGFVMFGAAQQARAADFGEGFLRGSTVVAAPACCNRWDGIYVGGQVGQAWTGTDFGNSTRSLVAFLLRNTTIENEMHPSNWTTLGKADTGGLSYGAFAGWQTQWEGAVVGVEASYSRTNLKTSSGDSMSRSFTTSDGYFNNVQVDASSKLTITDYATLRARGGWAAGNFMPYGFIGVAVGRGDLEKTARVRATGSRAGSPDYAFDETKTEGKTGAFAFGYTAGVGIDWALMQNIFVRAEYEYINFGSFYDLNTHIQTVRLGAGVKF